jgi:hypothetical protein
LTWQVVRDPRGVAADDAPSNDVFPRTGTQPLVTATVPPLTIRFVPIVLAANGNSTPSVTDAGLTEYLRTLRSIHPLGVVNAHIGQAFTTSSNFGTAPRGGEQTFWTDLLAELDLARIADPTESTINWYGVIAPPTGFNFTAYGGFSYIPSSGTSSGARTRTSLGVRTGWFSHATVRRHRRDHMQTVMFSTKNYDQRTFMERNAYHGYGHELIFQEARLTIETAPLVEGVPAVCGFVNDVFDAAVLEALAIRRVRMIALRSAGFNNVDLRAAYRCGIIVCRVPGYSPHSVAEFTVGLIISLVRSIHKPTSARGQTTSP